jgi:hypothetical protein
MKILGMIIGIALMTTVAAQAQLLQTRECNASNIALVAEAIAKMAEGKQKKTASDEIGLASEAMAEGKDDECKDHLLKATLQTK